MRDVVITRAVRTPIGRFLGQFQGLSAVELGAFATRALLEQAGLDSSEVEQLIFGCARQAGLGPNPARQVAWNAGLPETVPAFTINMACGSGLLAIVDAARIVATGEGECLVAGGMENMSRVPFLLPEARKGYRIGHHPLVDGMYQDGFFCPLAEELMGETAETLATRFNIGREEQDSYAARSQDRAVKAMEAGRFRDEIVPVGVAGRSGQTLHATDEHPRANVTVESLGKLPPVFDPVAGSVTAGNSSGITDGAAAVLVMSADLARGRGLTPLATIEGWRLAGVDPKVMGLGPVPSTRELLDRLGRSLSSYDLVELNEAFASQVLACDRELHLDHERLNVNGGSIALGHPIGATGTRIVVTLLHELVRREGQLGLATLCVSGGQGLSVSFRRGSA